MLIYEIISTIYTTTKKEVICEHPCARNIQVCSYNTRRKVVSTFVNNYTMIAILRAPPMCLELRAPIYIVNNQS